MEWISVEDKLPDEGARVIIWEKYGKRTAIHRFFKDRFEKHEWGEPDFDWWQPDLDPPKESHA